MPDQYGFATPQERRDQHMQWAAVAGLAQQHQQIALQRKALVQQALTNQLISQQMQQQAQVEQQRETQRLIDMWARELEHQGMSPMKALNQAQVELRIQELMTLATDIQQNFERSLDTAPETIREERKTYFTKPSSILVIISSISILLRKVISNSFVELASILGLIIGGCLYFYGASVKGENFDSKVSDLKRRLHDEHLLQMQSINADLEYLPASKFMNDSEFRELVAKEAGVSRPDKKTKIRTPAEDPSASLQSLEMSTFISEVRERIADIQSFFEKRNEKITERVKSFYVIRLRLTQGLALLQKYQEKEKFEDFTSYKNTVFKESLEALNILHLEVSKE